ncbi:ThiF family adenylyltransferase [Mesobacillus maritimus]|uniref:ThiF family adenylyltransferase n=1 Tax=Mesobacillus maritimus TaxID=1643336 RepID=UPI00203C32B6|nr:ThiF family adenylyltransferase [Mesobacillus maritimus]MCM3587470.1 ThiF family adenylyltransferase [Mesobacillus maritimus]
MTDRYSRQTLFSPIGKQGQEKLATAKVLIVGAGALGTASAEMLARAGVGKITIVDRDYVEVSNLQRQQMFTEEDARNKLPKAVAAQNRIQTVNSEIEVTSLIADVNGLNIEELVTGCSLIIDAVDNFETRLIVNDAAVKHQIPYLIGAIVASYGLTFPIIPGSTPCFHCIIDTLPSQNVTCDTVGVIGPIVQLVAAYQVTSALKLLTGHPVSNVLKSFDIWQEEKAEISVDTLKNDNCPTCGSQPTYPYLSFENQTKTEVLCGRNTVQLRPGITRSLSLEQLAESIKDQAREMVLNPYLLSCSFENHRIVFFKDGRALVHGTSEAQVARSLYNKIIG